VSSTQTHIVLLVLNSALEEALAGFTGKYSIMEARYFVPTYWAGAVDKLLPRDTSLSSQGRVLSKVC